MSMYTFRKRERGTGTVGGMYKCCVDWTWYSWRVFRYQQISSSKYGHQNRSRIRVRVVNMPLWPRLLWACLSKFNRFSSSTTSLCLALESFFHNRPLATKKPDTFLIKTLSSSASIPSLCNGFIKKSAIFFNSVSFAFALSDRGIGVSGWEVDDM